MHMGGEWVLLLLAVMCVCRQCITELEQVLPPGSMSPADEAQVIQSLPITISHMHDYFVHVAAYMERAHKEVSG